MDSDNIKEKNRKEDRCMCKPTALQTVTKQISYNQEIREKKTKMTHLSNTIQTMHMKLTGHVLCISDK